MSDGPTCASCRFFRGANPPICHRFPPNRIEMAVVDPSWWCGEYQPTRVATPSDEEMALAIVKGTKADLDAAADALLQAAKFLKDDGRGYRASEARQAAVRARTAAEGLSRA